MNIAAKVAAAKQKHPEDFCPVKGCLWRVYTSRGVVPCQNHPSEAERNTVSSGQREDSSPRVDLGGEIGPTVRSRAELLPSHDPRTCQHPHCRLAF